MRFSKKLFRNFRQVIHAIRSFTWRTLFPLRKLSRGKRSPLAETLAAYPSLSNTNGEFLFEHNWNVLGGSDDERYASLADLCVHVGEQLPTQVVKLIARDVLRELEHRYEARGVAHGGMFPSHESMIYLYFMLI
jgi:serine/threonine-protein kinase SRPK3